LCTTGGEHAQGKLDKGILEPVNRIFEADDLPLSLSANNATGTAFVWRQRQGRMVGFGAPAAIRRNSDGDRLKIGLSGHVHAVNPFVSLLCHDVTFVASR
jgi:hypothetical protein